ncbi:MAG: hypothetical protein J7578_17235 [Chitinophagaceae bacterium]|nr:hypothetical protein [Chitinophagaceae bacterium]
MLLKDQIQQLSREKGYPCVTISLATHRTFPDADADSILLKNLVTEATNRLLKEFDKRDIQSVLDTLQQMEKDIDPRQNSDGLYLFVSKNVNTLIRTIWPPTENRVDIDDIFALRDIIKAYNRSADYLILWLEQSKAFLYEAIDERAQHEIKEHGFPFPANPYYSTDRLKNSDPKQLDTYNREYFNIIDKAVNKVVANNPLPVVVATTRENFDLLKQVADRPSIYMGHFSTGLRQDQLQHLAAEAWELVKKDQHNTRAAAIEEMKKAVNAGKVVTDLQEIWRAAGEGRGDLLITHNDYREPASIINNQLEVNEDPTTPGVTDDIVNDIVWEVISKNGRVYFTSQPALDELGPIALKVRY